MTKRCSCGQLLPAHLAGTRTLCEDCYVPDADRQKARRTTRAKDGMGKQAHCKLCEGLFTTTSTRTQHCLACSRRAGVGLMAGFTYIN